MNHDPKETAVPDERNDPEQPAQRTGTERGGATYPHGDAEPVAAPNDGPDSAGGREDLAAAVGDSLRRSRRLTPVPRTYRPGEPIWRDADDVRERPYDPDRPDPMWALEDIDDDRYDETGRRRIPVWVIVVVLLMALALLLQLGLPMILDLLDRATDDSGFPTPPTI